MDDAAKWNGAVEMNGEHSRLGCRIAKARAGPLRNTTESLRLRSSFSEQPKEDGKNGADQQTGDDREMKAEVALAVVNVAREPAQPVSAEARPKQQADSGNDQAKDEQNFAQLIHGLRNRITF